MVRALTLIVGDGEAAAVSTQDAFLQAYRHWHRVSNLEDPAGWDRHAALNQLRNHQRGRHRMVAALSRLLYPQSVTTEAPDPVDLVPALAELPAQQRASVALYYLLDQPTSTIAETLGVTEAIVRSHLRDARLRLVRPLPEEEAG